MFRKLEFMSFKAWLLNGWYYVRFYWMAYLTKHFKKPPVNDIRKEGYELVFHDEFDTPPLDTKTWANCENWGCIRTNPETGQPNLIYKPEQVVVENGCAVMTTELNPQPEIYTEYESQTPEPLVKSGELLTWKCFVQKYGFVETREKLPPYGIDNWAAFWGYPADAWPPEIDVFELMGTNSSYITMTMHYPDWSAHKAQVDEIFSQINMLYKYMPKDVDDAIKFLRDPWTQERQDFIDKLISLRVVKSRPRRLKFPKKDFLAQDFHTYGLLWDEKKVVWYIDNIPVYILDKLMPWQPFQWLITNAVNGSYETPPATLPLKVYCDYFRGYKKL